MTSAHGNTRRCRWQPLGQLLSQVVTFRYGVFTRLGT